jgi:ubiquinone biosynthesis protein
MWIFKLRQLLRNFFRLTAIIWIIVRHYLQNWLTTGPLRKLVDRHGTKRISRSERLRLIIEDLGPTFIKFGQIIADRPDLASENLRLELKKLQSAARPFDDDHAIAIIEQEIGDSIATVFADFNRKHIASASIAQVYTGTLLTGEKVVLKVQRPGIRIKIKLDILLIQVFARKLQKSYPELNSFNIVKFIEDFGEIIEKELDFNNEVSNMLRFTHMFANDERCAIPKVYNRFCTQRLLVMEHIDGITPDNITELKEKGFDPQIIAENGMNVILTMILKHGFFHADPHAGNLFVRGNNQIVLIDHGMCASLKPKQINGLIHFMIGFADKNPHKIVKSLLALTEVTYSKHQEDLEFEIHELIQKYAYMEYDDVDLSGLFIDTFKLLMKYEIKIPSNLYMLLKTLVTIQKLAESLHAKISIIDFIRPYATEKLKERFSWNTLKSKFINGAEDLLYLVEQLPKDVRQIVTNFKNDGLVHTVKLGEGGVTNRQIKSNVYRIGAILLVGILLICATLLKIFNKQVHTVKGGTTISKEIFGNFPDIFFFTTVFIAVIVTVRLFLRSERS